MSSSDMQQAVAWIGKSNNILLLTHKKIDVDGLSSMIAFHLLLQKLQKNSLVVCEEPLPASFSFLPSTNVVGHDVSSAKDVIITIQCPDCEIDHLRYTMEEGAINIIITPKRGNISEKHIKLQKGRNKYDLIIVLDSPDVESIGPLYEKNVDLFFDIPVINIDHHTTNTYFGKINLVDITASSTCEIILSLLPLLSKETLMDENIATLLLAGIIVDTGSFQNPNTTPRSFAAASNLISYGARQQEIIKNIYKTKKLSTLKMWGKVLSGVQNDPIHRVVYSTLSLKDLKEDKNGARNDITNLIDDLLSNAPGTEIVLLFVEKANTEIWVYLKATNLLIDTTKIFSLFSPFASCHEGVCVFHLPLYEVQKIVIDAINAYQENRLGLFPGEETQSPLRGKTPAHPTTISPLSIPKIPASHLEQSIGDSLKEQLNEQQEQKRPQRKKK